MIYLDMDGVIANWNKSAEKLLGKPVSQVSRSQLWKRIDKEGFSFWADLEPYSWSKDFVAALKRLDEVMILTSPSTDPRSAAGKIRWLQKFFDNRSFSDFIITKHKRLLSQTGDILIDDREKKVDPFSSRGGVGILFPRQWNRNREHSKEPVKFVMDRLREIYPASRFDDDGDQYGEDYDDWLSEARKGFGSKNSRPKTRR